MTSFIDIIDSSDGALSSIKRRKKMNLSERIVANCQVQVSSERSYCFLCFNDDERICIGAKLTIEEKVLSSQQLKVPYCFKHGIIPVNKCLLCIAEEIHEKAAELGEGCLRRGEEKAFDLIVEEGSISSNSAQQRRTIFFGINGAEWNLVGIQEFSLIIVFTRDGVTKEKMFPEGKKQIYGGVSTFDTQDDPEPPFFLSPMEGEDDFSFFYKYVNQDVIRQLLPLAKRLRDRATAFRCEEDFEIPKEYGHHIEFRDVGKIDWEEIFGTTVSEDFAALSFLIKKYFTPNSFDEDDFFYITSSSSLEKGCEIVQLDDDTTVLTEEASIIDGINTLIYPLKSPVPGEVDRTTQTLKKGREVLRLRNGDLLVNPSEVGSTVKIINSSAVLIEEVEGKLFLASRENPLRMSFDIERANLLIGQNLLIHTGNKFFRVIEEYQDGRVLVEEEELSSCLAKTSQQPGEISEVFIPKWKTASNQTQFQEIPKSSKNSLTPFNFDGSTDLFREMKGEDLMKIFRSVEFNPIDVEEKPNSGEYIYKNCVLWADESICQIPTIAKIPRIGLTFADGVPLVPLCPSVKIMPGAKCVPCPRGSFYAYGDGGYIELKESLPVGTVILNPPSLELKHIFHSLKSSYVVMKGNEMIEPRSISKEKPGGHPSIIGVGRDSSDLGVSSFAAQMITFKEENIFDLSINDVATCMMLASLFNCLMFEEKQSAIVKLAMRELNFGMRLAITLYQVYFIILRGNSSQIDEIASIHRFLDPSWFKNRKNKLKAQRILRYLQLFDEGGELSSVMSPVTTGVGHSLSIGYMDPAGARRRVGIFYDRRSQDYKEVGIPSKCLVGYSYVRGSSRKRNCDERKWDIIDDFNTLSACNYRKIVTCGDWVPECAILHIILRWKDFMDDVIVSTPYSENCVRMPIPVLSGDKLNHHFSRRSNEVLCAKFREAAEKGDLHVIGVKEKDPVKRPPTKPNGATCEMLKKGVIIFPQVNTALALTGSKRGRTDEGDGKSDVEDIIIPSEGGLVLKAAENFVPKKGHATDILQQPLQDVEAFLGKVDIEKLEEVDIYCSEGKKAEPTIVSLKEECQKQQLTIYERETVLPKYQEVKCARRQTINFQGERNHDRSIVAGCYVPGEMRHMSKMERERFELIIKTAPSTKFTEGGIEWNRMDGVSETIVKSYFAYQRCLTENIFFEIGFDTEKRSFFIKYIPTRQLTKIKDLSAANIKQGKIRGGIVIAGLDPDVVKIKGTGIFYMSRFFSEEYVLATHVSKLWHISFANEVKTWEIGDERYILTNFSTPSDCELIDSYKVKRIERNKPFTNVTYLGGDFFSPSNMIAPLFILRDGVEGQYRFRSSEWVNNSEAISTCGLPQRSNSIAIKQREIFYIEEAKDKFYRYKLKNEFDLKNPEEFTLAAGCIAKQLKSGCPRFCFSGGGKMSFPSKIIGPITDDILEITSSIIATALMLDEVRSSLISQMLLNCRRLSDYTKPAVAVARKDNEDAAKIFFASAFSPALNKGIGINIPTYTRPETVHCEKRPAPKMGETPIDTEVWSSVCAKALESVGKEICESPFGKICEANADICIICCGKEVSKSRLKSFFPVFCEDCAHDIIMDFKPKGGCVESFRSEITSMFNEAERHVDIDALREMGMTYQEVRLMAPVFLDHAISLPTQVVMQVNAITTAPRNPSLLTMQAKFLLHCLSTICIKRGVMSESSIALWKDRMKKGEQMLLSEHADPADYQICQVNLFESIINTRLKGMVKEDQKEATLPTEKTPIPVPHSGDTMDVCEKSSEDDCYDYEGDWGIDTNVEGYGKEVHLEDQKQSEYIAPGLFDLISLCPDAKKSTDGMAANVIIAYIKVIMIAMINRRWMRYRDIKEILDDQGDFRTRFENSAPNTPMEAQMKDQFFGFFCSPQTCVKKKLFIDTSGTPYDLELRSEEEMGLVTEMAAYAGEARVDTTRIIEAQNKSVVGVGLVHVTGKEIIHLMDEWLCVVSVADGKGDPIKINNHLPGQFILNRIYKIRQGKSFRVVDLKQFFLKQSSQNFTLMIYFRPSGAILNRLEEMFLESWQSREKKLICLERYTARLCEEFPSRYLPKFMLYGERPMDRARKVFLHMKSGPDPVENLINGAFVSVQECLTQEEHLDRFDLNGKLDLFIKERNEENAGERVIHRFEREPNFTTGMWDKVGTENVARAFLNQLAETKTYWLNESMGSGKSTMFPKMILDLLDAGWHIDTPSFGEQEVDVIFVTARAALSEAISEVLATRAGSIYRNLYRSPKSEKTIDEVVLSVNGQAVQVDHRYKVMVTTTLHDITHRPGRLVIFDEAALMISMKTYLEKSEGEFFVLVSGTSSPFFPKYQIQLFPSPESPVWDGTIFSRVGSGKETRKIEDSDPTSVKGGGGSGASATSVSEGVTDIKDAPDQENTQSLSDDSSREYNIAEYMGGMTVYSGLCRRLVIRQVDDDLVPRQSWIQSSPREITQQERDWYSSRNIANQLSVARPLLRKVLSVNGIGIVPFTRIYVGIYGPCIRIPKSIATTNGLLSGFGEPECIFESKRRFAIFKGRGDPQGREFIIDQRKGISAGGGFNKQRKKMPVELWPEVFEVGGKDDDRWDRVCDFDQPGFYIPVFSKLVSITERKGHEGASWASHKPKDLKVRLDLWFSTRPCRREVVVKFQHFSKTEMMKEKSQAENRDIKNPIVLVVGATTGETAQTLKNMETFVYAPKKGDKVHESLAMTADTTPDMSKIKSGDSGIMSKFVFGMTTSNCIGANFPANPVAVVIPELTSLATLPSGVTRFIEAVEMGDLHQVVSRLYRSNDVTIAVGIDVPGTVYLPIRYAGDVKIPDIHTTLERFEEDITPLLKYSSRRPTPKGGHLKIEEDGSLSISNAGEELLFPETSTVIGCGAVLEGVGKSFAKVNLMETTRSLLRQIPPKDRKEKTDLQDDLTWSRLWNVCKMCEFTKGMFEAMLMQAILEEQQDKKVGVMLKDWSSETLFKLKRLISQPDIMKKMKGEVFLNSRELLQMYEERDADGKKKLISSICELMLKRPGAQYGQAPSGVGMFNVHLFPDGKPRNGITKDIMEELRVIGSADTTDVKVHLDSEQHEYRYSGLEMRMRKIRTNPYCRLFQRWDRKYRTFENICEHIIRNGLAMGAAVASILNMIFMLGVVFLKKFFPNIMEAYGAGDDAILFGTVFGGVVLEAVRIFAGDRVNEVKTDIDMVEVCDKIFEEADDEEKSLILMLKNDEVKKSFATVATELHGEREIVKKWGAQLSENPYRQRIRMINPDEHVQTVARLVAACLDGTLPFDVSKPDRNSVKELCEDVAYRVLHHFWDANGDPMTDRKKIASLVTKLQTSNEPYFIEKKSKKNLVFEEIEEDVPHQGIQVDRKHYQIFAKLFNEFSSSKKRRKTELHRKGQFVLDSSDTIRDQWLIKARHGTTTFRKRISVGKKKKLYLNKELTDYLETTGLTRLDIIDTMEGRRKGIEQIVMHTQRYIDKHNEESDATEQQQDSMATFVAPQPGGPSPEGEPHSSKKVAFSSFEQKRYITGVGSDVYEQVEDDDDGDWVSDEEGEEEEEDDADGYDEEYWGAEEDEEEEDEEGEEGEEDEKKDDAMDTDDQ